FRPRWDDIDEQAMTTVARDMKSPKGSKGNHATVTLTRQAPAIILRPPRAGERTFPYQAVSAQGNFMRACQHLEIEDLHFQDLRHEGISRLFEAGYQIHEVAQFSGHLDWGTLRRYTNLRPANLTLRE